MTDDAAVDPAMFPPLRMGLEARAFQDWLRPGPGDDAVLAERKYLIARFPQDVVAIRPDGEAAVAELAALLETRGLSGLSREDAQTSMAAMGRAVAEDLCLLTATDRGYRLTAGVLCFPNRWRLADKIGHGLVAVHGPVPDYPAALADAVERFMARLRPMRPFVRENWGFASRPDRYLPEPIPPVNPFGRDAFYLRTEEQGFLKLPMTQAVVFSIRTVIVPWTGVAEDRRAGLLATVKTLSPAWLAYKSIRL